jgi:hypothetical protein
MTHYVSFIASGLYCHKFLNLEFGSHTKSNILKRGAVLSFILFPAKKVNNKLIVVIMSFHEFETIILKNFFPLPILKM